MLASVAITASHFRLPSAARKLIDIELYKRTKSLRLARILTRDRVYCIKFQGRKKVLMGLALMRPSVSKAVIAAPH